MKLPKGWKIKAISDISDVAGGIQKGPHRRAAANPVRYLTVAHVQRNHLLLDDPRFFEVTADELQRWRLCKGDVLIIEGNGSADQIGRTALFRGEIEHCVHQNHVIRVRPNPNEVSSEYLNSLMNSSVGQAAVQLQSSTSSGLRTLSVGKIREIHLPLPPLPEQRKIADILSTWDEALETLDALIAAKERRKKAVMQRVLSWSVANSEKCHARHRLGEICERVTRRNAISSDDVLTISAQAGLVNQRDYFNRSVAGADLSKYYLLKQGEFAYNRSTAKGYPYGAIKRLDRYETGVVSTLYLCFRLKSNVQVSSNYLVHYFEGGYLNSGLRAVAKEGARAHGLLNVTAEDFFDLDVFLPPLGEQERIANVLETCDSELALLCRQRESLDLQKRGLMQRLLTGVVRVTSTPGADV